MANTNSEYKPCWNCGHDFNVIKTQVCPDCGSTYNPLMKNGVEGIFYSQLYTDLCNHPYVEDNIHNGLNYPYIKSVLKYNSEFPVYFLAGDNNDGLEIDGTQSKPGKYIIKYYVATENGIEYKDYVPLYMRDTEEVTEEENVNDVEYEEDEDSYEHNRTDI